MQLSVGGGYLWYCNSAGHRLPSFDRAGRGAGGGKELRSKRVMAAERG